MVMTSKPEQQPCDQSPPHIFIPRPWLFCHHPLSILSSLFLTLVLVLSVVTASQLIDSRDTFLRNTALPYPYLFTKKTNMSPSESSSEVQQRNLKETLRRTLLSKSSPTVQFSSSVLFEDTKRQAQISSMSAEVTPVTKPSVHQTLLTSSDISDVFEGTKYFTPQFSFTKDINYSEMQDKATAPSVPINAKDDVPKFVNEHVSSLLSKNIFKPSYISSKKVSSEITVNSSHNSLPSDSSTLQFSLVPYPHAIQSSEFQQQNPCPLSEDVLCSNSKKTTLEIAGNNSSSHTDLNAINSSNLSLSLASSTSSDITSLTETQSQERFEFSTSSVSVHISKLSDKERINSCKTNAVSKRTLRPNPLALSEPTRNLDTQSSENSTFDSVIVAESAFWKLSRFEDQMYWTLKHRNSSESTPQTLTQLKSLSHVSADKRITSKVSPALPQLSLSQANDSPDRLERITVLGLFEMTTRNGERAEGRSELAAARLAVSHINEKRLLPGYQLELITNDTKCDPGVGVDAFFHALYTQKSTRMVMLLGTACSEVTESLAKVMPYWNIVQVSFGSTSPVLSDRQEFPLFYRTVAPDSSHNPARLAFVRGFGWDTVTALSQNEDVYSLAVNDLVTELEQANITCRATITFAESDFKDQLRMLRDLDTRIIIGSFSHEVAPKIFCEAHHLGMYGSDYAWILQGGPSDIWWENVTECPQHHLAAAVEGLLLVSSHNSIVGVMPSYSGLTNTRFLEEFEHLSLPVTRYAPQTYDAVWAMALAMRGAQQKWKTSRLPISLHQFDYNRRDMTEEFLSQLEQLEFLGVSGPVSFSGADRIGISAFYQVQGGEVSKVALFHPSSDHMDYSCPDCGPLVWQGGQVPIDKRVCKLRVVTIEPAAFLSITCLALVGITLAFAFLAFNLHFRKLKYIKLSSPRLNNMAVVGCILVYTAVILLGLDHATLPTNTHFSAVCTARVYLLSAGFSLAFGSMFTKTYRVHRIFTRSRSGVVKNKLLQDTQLISLICVLLLIDGLIVTLWVIIDPIQRHLRNLTLEISASDRSVVYQPQVEVCRSQYTHGWLGALYGYKGLLLIVGVYMAWETRHVKIPALNDSQYIGMSVYSVVITSAIVVVLANLISERATLAFVTITTLILISTTATLCLLFLPKLHAIFGHADDNGDPIMHSMGLKIEYNTRRFVTDDRRELYYRVEVQNRVYRREIAALDLEIGRLKRQLIESPNASSDSMSEGAASKKTDLSPDERGASRKFNVMEMLPSPSVGGGLPLLLLSVLPPVIPRASWPSADHGNLPMRRQVTFSSEPKLDDSVSKQTAEESTREQEYYIICDSQDSDTETSGKPGVFSRLKNLLGSRPSSRKTSAASFSGTSSGGGIASALRLHMGYLAGLVPSSNMAAMTSSCNTSIAALNQYGLSGGPSSKELHPLKSFCGRAGGGSGPIISVTSNDEPEESTCFSAEDGNSVSRRKFSLGMCLSHKEDKDFGTDERRVSYSSMQKGMMQHQHSQPILSFRERAKGSPRFPHKIVPTCSLNALEDRRRSSSSAGATSYSANPSSSNPSYLARHQSSQHHLHVSKQTVGGHSHMGGKCRSLEDATSTGAGSSSASAGVSNWKPRAASYSPNCDVWATAEFGIPLSELGNSGRCKDKNVPQSVQRKDSQCSQVQM